MSRVKLASVLFSLSLINACGGSSSSSPSAPTLPPTPVYEIQGYGIKGPLTNATVNVYRLDASKEGGLGALLASATTDAQAKINNLKLKDNLKEYYVVEFLSNENTIDISTGVQPIIESLKTVVSAEQVKNEATIYASSLSTLIFELSLVIATNNSDYQDAQSQARATIQSIFGFGISDDIDISTTSPLFNDETSTQELQQNTIHLRIANESVASLLYALQQNIGDAELSINSLLVDIAKDASDGHLNAEFGEQSISSYNAQALAILQTPLEEIEVTHSEGLKVLQLPEKMIAETEITGFQHLDFSAIEDTPAFYSANQIAFKQDLDNDGLLNHQDLDKDGDGYSDIDDAFSVDANEWLDTDLDRIGNNADADDDNDGYSDSEDAFPLNQAEWLDTDSDGIGNNQDQDDDGDGVEDVVDVFPLDPTETIDSDNDGLGNNSDTDDDNDGYADVEDAFPLDQAEWLDTDTDGIGNNQDHDDDGDGVEDLSDAFPLDSTETNDLDLDGIGDNADPDDDNDGTKDSEDNLDIGGMKQTYAREESVTIQVRGKDNDGVTALHASDGWNVSYLVYDQRSPNTRLTQYTNQGYTQGVFNSASMEWNIEYPAPAYSGNFRSKVVLYCSKPGSLCGGKVRTEQWEQEYFFSVSCPENTNCDFVPEPEPGVNVTQNTGSAEITSMLKRSTGEVIIAYRLFAEDGVSHFLSTSTDNGQSWEVISELESPTNTPYIAETSAGNLLMIRGCGAAICIQSSTDEGKTWQALSHLDFSNYTQCNEFECSTNSFLGESIIETNSGEYVISYSHDTGAGTQSDVFIRTSSDLEVWAEAQSLATNPDSDFDSTITQRGDGSYVFAYVSYMEKAIVVSQSTDAKSWTEISKLPITANPNTDPQLLIDGKKVRLFYTSEGSLYTSVLTKGETPSTPLIVKSGLAFSAKVIKLDNGTFAIAYSLDLNNKRDIFFENIGALD